MYYCYLTINNATIQLDVNKAIKGLLLFGNIFSASPFMWARMLRTKVPNKTISVLMASFVEYTFQCLHACILLFSTATDVKAYSLYFTHQFHSMPLPMHCRPCLLKV